MRAKLPLDVCMLAPVRRLGLRSDVWSEKFEFLLKRNTLFCRVKVGVRGKFGNREVQHELLSVEWATNLKSPTSIAVFGTNVNFFDSFWRHPAQSRRQRIAR